MTQFKVGDIVNVSAFEGDSVHDNEPFFKFKARVSGYFDNPKNPNIFLQVPQDLEDVNSPPLDISDKVKDLKCFHIGFEGEDGISQGLFVSDSQIKCTQERLGVWCIGLKTDSDEEE